MAHDCILISSIVSQMNQYCKTKRKTIVLQMDICGKTNQKQLYALYADRDNENDLENLGEDSDTEIIPVTEEVREALIKLDNNIDVEGTASITGDVQRPSLDMENLEAVVHDTIAELSPVSSPTSSRISNRSPITGRIKVFEKETCFANII